MSDLEIRIFVFVVHHISLKTMTAEFLRKPAANYSCTHTHTLACTKQQGCVIARLRYVTKQDKRYIQQYSSNQVRERVKTEEGVTCSSETVVSCSTCYLEPVKCRLYNQGVVS